MPVLGAGAGGGGGGGQLPTISFMTSQTWTPSYDLTAYVYVIGGGGAGGTKQAGAGGACGGGAGGCAVSKLDLSSGTTYTITIGAGGASQTAAGSNVNGNAGGATSFEHGLSPPEAMLPVAPQNKRKSREITKTNRPILYEMLHRSLFVFY